MLAGGLLFAVWIAAHKARLTADDDALIRFTLGILFAVLITVRSKDNPKERKRQELPGWMMPAALICGLAATFTGIVFQWHMVEWVGILALLFACFSWALPAKYGRDLVLAFFILFWMHPLPGQVFGWLQMEMQRLSVMGAERVLQVANVRVWADMNTLTLRTGYQNFMVPESCSGMRTAVTVFLCTIGVGTLLRLRWYETVFFVWLGLAQVLVLNIVRISYMVWWAPRMPTEWAENFLHDSLGIFLMAAILLVQLEAAWWHYWSRLRARIREGIRRNEIEPETKASIVPHPLRRLIFWSGILVAVLVPVLTVAGVIFKNRAYHRKEMIRDVAEGLIDSDAPAALRAIDQALKLEPGDAALLSMKARASMVAGLFKEGLDVLEAKTKSGKQLTLEDQIIRCWALMRLERIKEAREIIDSLPAGTDELPGVAMLKAELGARDNNPDAVAHYVETASEALPLLGRIRRLFPYLARHEQWEAISKADRDQPYEEAYQALIALYANQQIRNPAGVAQIMNQAMKSWPDDVRFLPDLFRLVAARQGGGWDALFEHNLLANLEGMSAEHLAQALDFCWRILRPGLAWTVYLQLQRVDPHEPALMMSAVQYGNRWFRFNRHRLGVRAESAAGSLDLRPLMNMLKDVTYVRTLKSEIPLADELAGGFDSKLRTRYLELCLAELARRDKAGTLTLRLERLYSQALVMSGKFDEAHARLDMTLSRHPGLEGYIRLQHALIYDRQGKWQKSYEELRSYFADGAAYSLKARLIMIQSCMNLNLSVIAMDVLQRAREEFPGSVRLALAESAIWDVFGFKEQALHVMMQIPGGDTSPVCVGLLYDTGRINAARHLSEATGVPLPAYRRRQLLKLPAASFFMVPHWQPPPDRAQREKRIKELAGLIHKASSPYIKRLYQLELALQQSIAGGDGFGNAVTEWEQAGRDDAEKSAALYQLTLLAAREKEYAVAEKALRHALKYMPDSQILWRALIGVVSGDPAVVEDAWKRCPQDSEIMLVRLVIKSGGKDGKGAADWAGVTNMVHKIASSQDYAPGTLVRAGDRMLELGRNELAAELAHAAIPRSRGLPAAYVLGVRTALKLHDPDWASVCTISGIENAEDPVPFYKVLVDIKAGGNQVDSYLLEALEYLREKQSRNPRWAAMLGRIYFQKGDMQRSLSIFSSVLKGDTRNIDVGTLILAAEAARRKSKMNKAIGILEAAYAMQPDQLNVLNNLVYLLAQNPRTLPRARALLPKLEPKAKESFAVMDTVAVVYMKSGDLENARKWMRNARASIDDNSYSAPEVRLNTARLLIKDGKYDEARANLQQLQQNASRTDYIDREARDLLQDIKELSDGL